MYGEPGEPGMRVLWEHVGSEAYSHHMREYPNARVRECACVYAQLEYILGKPKYTARGIHAALVRSS